MADSGKPKAQEKVAVVSGGGTAGHVYPALALSEELQKRGWKVYFAGTPEGVEKRLARDAGLEFEPFEASGFSRRHPLSLPKGVARIYSSSRKARKWLSKIGADVVVGFGGYASIPVAMAAEKLGIPVVVHEQNSVAGMANKYIARHADVVCLTYKEAEGEFAESSHFALTGNPVRESVGLATREAGRAYLGVPEDATLLLVFGGSSGARHINQAFASMKDRLLSQKGLYVVHIAGPKEFEATSSALRLDDSQKERYILKPYEDKMALALAAADAAVTRAGATTLAEVSELALPVLLVPYPYATGDHQRKNARSLVEAGAALAVDDSKVDSEAFREKVMELATNAQMRESMHAAHKELKSEPASKLLADQVELAASKA